MLAAVTVVVAAVVEVAVIVAEGAAGVALLLRRDDGPRAAFLFVVGEREHAFLVLGTGECSASARVRVCLAGSPCST